MKGMGGSEASLDHLLSRGRADVLLNDDLVRVIQDGIKKAELSLQDGREGEADGIVYIHCDAVRELGDRLEKRQVHPDRAWERADVLWKLLAVFSTRLPRTENVERFREAANAAMRKLNDRVELQRIPDVVGTLTFATTLYSGRPEKVSAAIGMAGEHFDRCRLSAHQLTNAVRGLAEILRETQDEGMGIKAAGLLMKLDRDSVGKAIEKLRGIIWGSDEEEVVIKAAELLVNADRAAAEEAIEKRLERMDDSLSLRVRLRLGDVLEPGRRHLSPVPGRHPAARRSLPVAGRKTHPAAGGGVKPSSYPPGPTARSVKKA